MLAEQLPIEDQIAEDIIQFEHDPLGHAYYAYDWGEGDLEGWEGPKQWQQDMMNRIGDHLSNPETRYKPYRDAISSGNGICHWCVSPVAGCCRDKASACKACRVNLLMTSR